MLTCFIPLCTALLTFSFLLCCLADDHNLQDSCPTDLAACAGPTFINGLPCKDPANVTSADFRTTRLNQAGDTDTLCRSSVNILTAAEFPGVNTLGLSVARTDMEVDGFVAPHSHPRASEILMVSEGVVIFGFVDTRNRGFQKVLREGDVFVVPRGLLHYCFNVGFERATMFSVLNSQNPGVVSITDAVLGSEPEAARRLTMRLASVHKVHHAYDEDYEAFARFNSLEAATKLI